MIRVERIVRHAGTAADSVTLDLEQRRKRRHVIETAGGLRVLVDLAEPPQIRDGDGLVLEDGRIVAVRALPEALLEIETDDPVRIAWHLGNRHVPTQIVGPRLRIRTDHVIEHMLEGLGCRIARIEAAFDPEGGAYGGHHDHA